MTTHSGEKAQAECQRIETVIREWLPALLVEEYGETEADWTELHSVRRIAAALADRIALPRTSPGEPR